MHQTKNKYLVNTFCSLANATQNYKLQQYLLRQQQQSGDCSSVVTHRNG